MAYWTVVPMLRRDLNYFDRQRDMLSDWLSLFENHWRVMEPEDAAKRFEGELERTKKGLLHLNSQELDIDVAEPFVTDPEGTRKLSLRFDCSEFDPSELRVATKGNVLSIHAKHVEDTPGKKLRVEFTKNYTLPPNVDPMALKSTLSSDGVLQIEAPAPPAVQAPRENLIPIERLDRQESIPMADGATADGSPDAEMQEKK
ncbi:alpha-crystallin A chain-like [Mya arenaria]|uniref:alpha-crystallin A chain-like n=1 Tax=Mya arenaria TaxID=6604 RepID=UPI0022DF3AFB|nr:alpha-crystallin A chain-like [Mya arenaria]